MFPDTAEFDGNIVEATESERCNAMEKYAQTVLTLLVPHRHKDDIMSSAGNTKFPYIQKLQEIYDSDQKLLRKNKKARVFHSENMLFLQNIQDSRANAIRYKLTGDDLERCTKPHEVDLEGNLVEVDDTEDQQQVLITAAYEDFLEELVDWHLHLRETLFVDEFPLWLIRSFAEWTLSWGSN